jgi:hypothetical protein
VDDKIARAQGKMVATGSDGGAVGETDAGDLIEVQHDGVCRRLVDIVGWNTSDLQALGLHHKHHRHAVAQAVFLHRLAICIASE